jgi:Trehalase-like, N-terminal
MSSDRTSESASYPPIGDYAIIGDCRSAGLVYRDGSLDWLCLPRFDSPSIFAAVLDAENGGRFLVRPVGEFRTERRYLPDTNVLETVFRTPSGACVLRDLMPVSSEEDKRAYLTPEHEVLQVSPHARRHRSLCRTATRCEGISYFCPTPSSADATSKQQRGLSPRSHCSRTGTPASSAIIVSAMRQTSGWFGVTPASGQL